MLSLYNSLIIIFPINQTEELKEEQSSVNHHPNTHTFCESFILPLSKRLQCIKFKSYLFLFDQPQFGKLNTQTGPMARRSIKTSWEECTAWKQGQRKVQNWRLPSGCLQRKNTHDPLMRATGGFAQARVIIPRVYLLQFCDAHGIKLVQERTSSFYLTKTFMLTLILVSTPQRL